MLTGHQQRQLRRIEIRLHQSDPWLARSLAEHRLWDRPLRQRIADFGHRMVTAWMEAAGQAHHSWPEQRWY